MVFVSGTRSALSNYEKCYIGKVKANAMVTRGGDLYNETEINAYINLFTYAQQYYSRKVDEEFRYIWKAPRMRREPKFAIGTNMNLKRGLGHRTKYRKSAPIPVVEVWCVTVSCLH